MSLRIVMAQLNLTVGGLEKNTDALIDAAIRARDEMQAQAIVFPELSLSGYPPEDLLLRPGFLATVEEQLQRLQDAVTGIHMIVGYPEQEGAVRYNSACVIRDGQKLACYRKQHLPNYSVFDEKRYFVPGDNVCVVDIDGVQVGITICEDIWHEQPLADTVAAGAELILNLNASPFHYDKLGQREEVLRQRCREQQVPIVYVNLVGGQDELVFDGHSMVWNAQAELVQRAPAFEAGLHVVDIENLQPQPAAIENADSLEATVYQALVSGVRDYVTKNGFSGAILGLPGGIDSALTLAIAADALGADKVKAVMMPSRYSADMSLEDALKECKNLGVAHETVPIEPAFVTFMDMLKPVLGEAKPDVTEQNIQARCRGVILMALSNREGRMLLTTGNKSEMAVGYATLYGDMAGGFAPIKDVPKLLVYRLSKYRNTLGECIPERVIERPPSAELAPDQLDSDSLPPYEVLDPILELYVEQDLSVADIVARGFERETVTRVAALVDRNEYKRRQAPPGVRITTRAFGRDRRYPITSGWRGRH